jgi:hypothetical protein
MKIERETRERSETRKKAEIKADRKMGTEKSIPLAAYSTFDSCLILFLSLFFCQFLSGSRASRSLSLSMV